jgi:hypothetical protein
MQIAEEAIKLTGSHLDQEPGTKQDNEQNISPSR